MRCGSGDNRIVALRSGLVRLLRSFGILLSDGPADFAAAVIAGALPPTPQSMEELIRRIGTAEIPLEAQARLRDLLA